MRLSFIILAIVILFSTSLQISAKEVETQTSGSQKINAQTANNELIIHQIYQLVDDRNPNSPVFQQALQSNNEKLIKIALIGLGRIGGKTVIKTIVPFLKSNNETFRQHAAFALSINGNKEASHYLWQQLKNEKSELVKKEIYLGLGALGGNHLISKMLAHLDEEKSAVSRAYLFQGLAIALTFHRGLKDDYSKVDYKKLLSIFAKGDKHNAMAGYFLNRVPNIENYITSQDLLAISKKNLSPEAKINLTRLITKTTSKKQQGNRELLTWVIEQSESSNLPIKLSAIYAYKNLTDIPQTLIQLGKLQADKNPIVAHTALNTLAISELNSEHLIKLLKNQLKNKNDAMVVEAIGGLIKRQDKEKMSWVVKLFPHPSSYVKISLINKLFTKSKTDFENLIRHFTQDPNQEVANYAKQKLAQIQDHKNNIKNSKEKNLVAKSPSFAEAMKATEKVAVIKTAQGDIKIQLLSDAPFTSWHFLNNAKLGHYKNSYFSRVIGNFVAQGGDTIGDLEGSSKKTIREEINFVPHDKLTVGMATSGKDTGTSQFFINTARNPHLDRNYTVFARVIAGEDLVMQMTNGLKILNVEVE